MSGLPPDTSSSVGVPPSRPFHAPAPSLAFSAQQTAQINQANQNGQQQQGQSEQDISDKMKAMRLEQQQQAAAAAAAQQQQSQAASSNQQPAKKKELGAAVRYAAERVIGNGSFGVVYQATVIETGETVAIKKVLQDPKFKNRELQILGMMNHPDVISLKHCFYAKGEKPDEVFLNLVMDYIPDTIHRTLRTYTKANKLLPMLHTKVYMYQIARSIAYIHSLGVCHRDIKPQNLLLNTKNHHVLLCDFGSAKVLVPGEPNVSYICSRYYRAPELVFEATQYTTQIDVWSLGCVMAEMLLGNPLFPGESVGTGTPVLMYDGTIRPVESIAEGDVLMGEDSTPRLVESITSGNTAIDAERWTPEDEDVIPKADGEYDVKPALRPAMYEIKPQWAVSAAYTANGKHKLPLRLNVPPFKEMLPNGQFGVFEYSHDGNAAHAPTRRQLGTFDLESDADADVAARLESHTPLDYVMTVESYFAIPECDVVKQQSCQYMPAETKFTPLSVEDVPGVPRSLKARIELVLQENGLLKPGSSITDELVQLSAYALGAWSASRIGASENIHLVGRSAVAAQLHSWRSSVVSQTPVEMNVDEVVNAISIAAAKAQQTAIPTDEPLQVFRVEHGVPHHAEDSIANVEPIAPVATEVEMGSLFRSLLKSYDMLTSERLPLDLRTESVDIRRQLLSGMIDAVGSATRQGFALVASSKKALLDGAFIARSIGFAAGDAIELQNGAFTMEIFAHAGTEWSQLSMKHTKSAVDLRDVPTFGLFTVNRIADGEYWSVTVAGPKKKFLFGDFVVTHNSAVDQLIEIIKVLGTPTREEIHAMNPNHTSFKFPQIKPNPWPKVFRNKAPATAIDLVSKWLRYEPKSRLDPFEALAHPFFDELREPGAKMTNQQQPIPEKLFQFTENELKMMQQKGLTKKLIPPHLMKNYKFKV